MLKATALADSLQMFTAFVFDGKIDSNCNGASGLRGRLIVYDSRQLETDRISGSTTMHCRAGRRTFQHINSYQSIVYQRWNRLRIRS